MNTHNLVLCESPDGWSLHAPGSTDEDIASGNAKPLASGPGQLRQLHYDAALRALEHTPMTVKTRKHNPHEWHLELGRDGYYVINEYGEEVMWAAEDYPNAQLVLKNLTADELAAQHDNGPDRDPPGFEAGFAENH